MADYSATVQPEHPLYGQIMDPIVPADNPIPELGNRVHQLIDHKFQARKEHGDFRDNIEDVMGPFRDACQAILLADFVAAQREHVDGALWNMHTRIHGKFRQTLGKITAQESANSPAWRRTAREYVQFIKESQRSYRQFLRDLDARHPGISNLKSIAMSFSTSSDTGTQQHNQIASDMVITDQVKDDLIDLTCETLLHLGDLSRWRYVGRLDTRANSGWKTAAAFYGLAQEVNPASGFPQHQLAVLALADTKVFYALYDLYRSLSAQRTHPEANANLDLLLRRRLVTPSTSELIRMVQPKQGSKTAGVLRAWFLKLQVSFYAGVDFTAHDEMENEVLARLSVALNDGEDLSSTLFQIVIITIAAESVALGKAQANIEPVKNAQAYFFFVRHNVRIFMELLKHLHDILESQSAEGRGANQENAGTVKFPPVSEAAMFSLRIYVLWFTKNWSFLQRCTESEQIDLATAGYIRSLFTIIAPTLSFIYEQYPLSSVPATAELEYLLKEEEATMGFLPLQDEANSDAWIRNGAMKSVLRDAKSEEQQASNHLVRLRDIFTRLAQIAQDSNSPFVLTESGKILYDEGAGPSELFSPTLAQEAEGEPITPPPTAGGDNVVLAGSTEDLDNQRLWFDGAADTPVRKGKERPTFHSAHETPKNWGPVQMPFVLLYEAIDCIWRNDAVSAENALKLWPQHLRFGNSLYPHDT